MGAPECGGRDMPQAARKPPTGALSGLGGSPLRAAGGQPRRFVGDPGKLGTRDVRPDQDLSPAVDSEDKSKRWRFDLASAKPVERTPRAVHRPSTIGNPRPKPGNPST